MQQSPEAILAYQPQKTTNNGGARWRIRSDRSRRIRTQESEARLALRFLIFSDQFLASATMATTAVKGERRWRKSKRRAERTRDEAAKEPVVHPNVLRG